MKKESTCRGLLVSRDTYDIAVPNGTWREWGWCASVTNYKEIFDLMMGVITMKQESMVAFCKGIYKAYPPPTTHAT